MVRCSCPRAHTYTYNFTLNQLLYLYSLTVLKKIIYYIRPFYRIVTFKHLVRTGSAKQYQPSIQPTKSIEGIMLCFFDYVPNRRFSRTPVAIHVFPFGYNLPIKYSPKSRQHQQYNVTRKNYAFFVEEKREKISSHKQIQCALIKM